MRCGESKLCAMFVWYVVEKMTMECVHAVWAMYICVYSVLCLQYRCDLVHAGGGNAEVMVMMR